ncbi:hypothetical protein [Streptomyces sp. S186]|uniref:hypothetical protein n=1 Tax=Streptomyces sp. S186 TaxID=3434395 RepID=UPI003F662C70
MADHNDRTPYIPGQRQESSAADHGQALDFPEAPPVPSLEELDKEPRLAGLREWWADAWDGGGFLHDRWEDLRRAPELGWHGMANWVKAVLGLAGICAALILLDGATDILADTLHRLLTAVPRVQVGADTSNGVFAVVDQPIRSYIAAHSASLPISASTIYTVWQLVGIFGLVGGFFRSSGARLTWTAWGAASIAMVYSAAPADGRTIAIGLAVLAWTAASAFALRGLTLRPTIFTHIHNAGHQIEPHIHLPAPPAPPAEDSAPPSEALTRRPAWSSPAPRGRGPDRPTGRLTPPRSPRRRVTVAPFIRPAPAPEDHHPDRELTRRPPWPSRSRPTPSPRSATASPPTSPPSLSGLPARAHPPPAPPERPARPGRSTRSSTTTRWRARARRASNPNGIP